MKKLMLLLFFVSSLSHADSLAMSFGPSLDGTIGEIKALQLGYEFQGQGGSFSLLLEGGGWNYDGEPIFFGGVNAGVHVVTLDGISMRVGVGPSYASGTDDRISSQFNFHIQAKIGLQVTNFSTGLQFDHFSNAGLWPPNLGRDLLSVYIGFPL